MSPLKLIILFIILYYLWSRVGKYFLNTFSGSSQGNAGSQNRNTSHQKQGRRTQFRYKSSTKSEKKFSDFKGGEYVDYEELE